MLTSFTGKMTFKIKKDPSFDNTVNISALIQVEGKSTEFVENGLEWIVQQSRCESQENEEYLEAKELSAG